MNKQLILCFLLLLNIILISGCKTNRNTDSANLLPDLQMKVNNPQYLKYLGVDKNQFKLSQIKADYLIIEIFSMYCPRCQKTASETVSLFDWLKKKKLSNSVKIIGIAATNTPLEADIYKAKYKIPFPLIADKETTLASALNVGPIPHFFLAERIDNNSFKIIYQQSKELLNTELIKKKLDQ